MSEHWEIRIVDRETEAELKLYEHFGENAEIESHMIAGIVESAITFIGSESYKVVEYYNGQVYES